MFITNETSIQSLKTLKQSYNDLPWYQRFWFSLWSYDQSAALSTIDDEKPTTEQVNDLLRASEEAWFFNSIFNLLTQFRATISRVGFSDQNIISGQAREIKEEIGVRLDAKDLVALSLTSEATYAFFESRRQINQFLLAIAHGEYYAVATLLANNIDLLLHKGRVTDHSGRTFFYISGFQYALWALDKHMWMKMLSCLPNDEKGAKIKAELLKQYQELKEKRVAYELNGKRIRENHFDFENIIIKELRTQVNDVNNFANANKTWDEIDQQWRKGVGSAQKLLPMHVVYEYCSKVPFDPPPEFIEQPALIQRFHNWLSKEDESWFHSTSRLGSDFAIVKGRNKAQWCRQGRALGVMASVREDLLAMETLHDVRTVDFTELESLLKEALAPDDQVSASPFVNLI